MKRQFKAAALVSTAALLAIGASFTSMAASKAKTGTWVLEADGWYCYDKNGEAYTNEWCMSYGKEYFVDENGLLATHSWIEDDDKYYFVGSTGAKTVNDWRYVTPIDADDEEEQWFYFNAKGEMQTGKKVINGKTYYFDQNGVMLTGWVDYEEGVAEEADNANGAGTATLTYCDETGARLSEQWIETWAPGVDVEEVEDDDVHWYYVRSNGYIRTGKANDIKGKTYLFDKEGQMLTGWVLATDEDSNNVFDEYESTEQDINGVTLSGNQAYFFCDEENGDMKKDKWIKTWTPSTYKDEDEDIDKYWYWVEKGGKVYIPNSDTYAEGLTFVDGELGAYNGFKVSSESNAAAAYSYSTKKVNGKTYAFRNDARMWTGFVDVYSATGSDADRYYFGGDNDGKMAKGNTTITDQDGVSYKFYFGEKDKNGYTEGVGVNGAANNYLYQEGMLVKQSDAKYAWRAVLIDGEAYFFVVNNNGSIQTAKKDYKENGEVLPGLSKDDVANGFVTGNTAGPLKGSWIPDAE